MSLLPPRLIVLGRAPATGIRLVKPPDLTGLPEIGATLTLSDGVWTENLAFEKRYLRAGVPIPGATGNSYAVTAADEGQQLIGQVRALDSGGNWSGWAMSAPLTIRGTLFAGVFNLTDRVLNGADIVIYSE